MKPLFLAVMVAICASAHAAETVQFRNTYGQAYGETKGAVSVDPAKDLPRYPAVEPKDAIATWKALASSTDEDLPKDAILMELGKAYQASGNQEEARKAFTEIVHVAPLVQSFARSITTRS